MSLPYTRALLSWDTNAGVGTSRRKESRTFVARTFMHDTENGMVDICRLLQLIISTPVGVAVCPDLAKFGIAPRSAGAEIQNFASWKFCPQTHIIYVSSVIDVDPAVSEHYLWGFENVDTAWTDARTDGHLTGFRQQRHQ